MIDTTRKVKESDCVHARRGQTCRRYPKTAHCNGLCGEAEFHVLEFDAQGEPYGFLPYRYADLYRGRGLDLRDETKDPRALNPAVTDRCEQLAEEAWRIATGGGRDDGS